MFLRESFVFRALIPRPAWHKRGRFMGNIRYKLSFLYQPVFPWYKSMAQKQNYKIASRKLTKRQVEAIQTCFPCCIVHSYRHLHANLNQASNGTHFLTWRSPNIWGETSEWCARFVRDLPPPMNVLAYWTWMNCARLISISVVPLGKRRLAGVEARIGQDGYLVQGHS